MKRQYLKEREGETKTTAEKALNSPHRKLTLPRSFQNVGQ